MTKLKMIAAVAGLALASAAAPASAADLLLNLTSSTNSADTGSTNYRDYSFTLDGVQISARATAWSVINNTVTNAYLGSYTAGLGVTADNENGGNGTHTIDNNGAQDFIVFQFSRDVLLSKITTTPFDVNNLGKDSDALVAWGKVSTAWNQSLGLDGKSVNTLNALLSGGQDLAGGSSTSIRSVTGSASNLWLVAAGNNLGGDKVVDGFKLANVTVTSAVPEPATWMMMIGGFAMVGAAVRRRKSVAGGAAVA
ncbi:PEPxxWA-CTERM sorting domain-containing protein [Sphingomonas sp. BK580]|uniref:PEPxxWA-CTERM sorting domain-containing protein n=1 Tax=Sphingomonas sp. BK580 TaxID=2586972 RepID=UPI00160E79D7|nr:PEPxxWA-CTERM sorting domain-containing protein [Sphingomonas sp. BK580]MBB3694679.1 hypothetical protein [Sphingomonas sp. BK580]